MCTFKKAIKIFEVKVNVQKRFLRSENKLRIDVLVSSNLPYIIQMMCGLGSNSFEIYSMDGENLMTFSLESDNGLCMYKRLV